MALTTLAEIKDYLGIAVATYDSKLELFRESVEQSVINYCEVDFELHIVVKEIHDSINSDVLVSKYGPIISVQGVYFNCDPDGENGELIDTSLYGFDAVAIYFNGISTPATARKNIRLDYTHGYTSVPADVKLATIQAVKAEFNRDSDNTEHVSSRAKEDENESYNSAWDKKTGLPVQIVSKLQPYRVYEFPMVGMAQRNR